MLKKFKPITPSSRNLIRLCTKNLNNKPLLKSKILGFKLNSGRNSLGRITCRHRGGGHKKKYRELNLYRNSNIISIVLSVEYDPNRSANIVSVYNICNKRYDYYLAAKNVKIGDVLKSGDISDIKNGNSLPISKIPLGSFIHCVSLKKRGKAILSRSAGTSCELVEKNNVSANIILCSKQRKSISIECFAVIGSVSNESKILTNVGKAGRSRWLNKRPKVRGVAMNPVDHPHGGGEGKTSGGRTSVTPWGKPGKNKKTSRRVVKSKKY